MPDGVTSILVELWGGGGGGAAGGTTGGGGGAGGSYARATFAVSAGEQFTLSVASGGDGLMGQDGLAGGQTEFVDGDRGLYAYGGGAGPARAAVWAATATSSGRWRFSAVRATRVATHKAPTPAPAAATLGSKSARWAALAGPGAPASQGPNAGRSGQHGYALISS